MKIGKDEFCKILLMFNLKANIINFDSSTFLHPFHVCKNSSNNLPFLFHLI